MDDDSDFDLFLKRVAKTPDAPPPKPRLEPGYVVGPYRIVSFIGDGGMGTVYRAQDSRGGLFVALKMIRGSNGPIEHDIERFRREAELLSRIVDKHVVRIHEAGVHQETPWLALELLNGQTLRQTLADGAVPADRALQIAEGILRGLVATHAAGIVHRDIKPSNVFVTNDGTVKLLDFGLAKQPQRGDDSTPDRRLTGIGALLGTPHYMSPEQARGQEVDERTDLFSVGTVCYEMLRGKHPFAEKNTLDTLYAVTARKPTLLGDMALGVSAPATAWLERCMQKDPEKRFASAQLALDALVAARR